MNIGKNIQTLRELRNYTQQYMANQLEINQKTYSNIEHAGNRITIETIDKISKVLNVSIQKIIEVNAETIINNQNQQGGVGYISNGNYISNEKERELYEKLIAEKDEIIRILKAKK